MSFPRRQVHWFYQEFGLKSLHKTGRDAYLIILSRTFRMLAYGTTGLILALFFSALEFSDTYIGVFMTLTLLGDVLLSLGLSLVADRVGRRKVLLVGSMMMVVSGVFFAYFENFWILLFAAVIGVISATGADFGPFRAIEESTIAHLTTPETRADVMSWYVTTSSVGSAVGAELSGRMVNLLQGRDGWTVIDAYHAIYWIYCGMGIFNIGLTLLLSERCEARESEGKEASDILLDRVGGDQENGDPEIPSKPPKKSRVDSLADGMTGYSLTVYYLDLKFSISKAALGDITSISYILSSCSSIFAGPLSRRLGLINTMVFTHLPSSAAVLLFPAPRGVVLTIALFFLRTGLNNMDQAPRSAFISAVVKAEERTAVHGITGTLRTLAAATGPTVTGVLAGNDHFWVAFVAAGILRIAYDLGLWAMFINMKLYQHESAGVNTNLHPAGRSDNEEVEAESLLAETRAPPDKSVDGSSRDSGSRELGA